VWTAAPAVELDQIGALPTPHGIGQGPGECERALKEERMILASEGAINAIGGGVTIAGIFLFAGAWLLAKIKGWK